MPNLNNMIFELEDIKIELDRENGIIAIRKENHDIFIPLTENSLEVFDHSRLLFYIEY